MGVRKGSRQRDEILKVLKSAHDHPDAFTIYERVRKSVPGISLATVYRNLAALTEEKVLLRIDGGSAGAHFDGDMSPHYHAVCRLCGRIDDIPAGMEEEIDSFFKNSYGGIIEGHSLMFYGLCPECAKNEKLK